MQNKKERNSKSQQNICQLPEDLYEGTVQLSGLFSTDPPPDATLPVTLR